MKIIRRTKYGYTYTKFTGKYVEGVVYDGDGSGELIVKSPEGYVRCGDYYEASGFHADRLKDIKKLAKIYSSAYKELSKLEKMRKLKKLKK